MTKKMVKKVTSVRNNRPHIQIRSSNDELEMFTEYMMKEITRLENEIADMVILAESNKESKCVYELTFEEYMQLSGRARL